MDNGDYDGFPGVTIDTSRLKNTSIGPEDEFIHLDDIEGVDTSIRPHIYVYDDEGRDDELAETIVDLRQQFILATGITYPPWMRDEMPLETDVLIALDWAVEFGGELTPELLESVKEELNNGE